MTLNSVQYFVLNWGLISLYTEFHDVDAIANPKTLQLSEVKGHKTLQFGEFDGDASLIKFKFS